MDDIEKVIKALETCRKTDCANCEYSKEVCLIDEIISDAIDLLKEQEDLGTELTNAVELIHKKNERIEKLLKEQEAVKPKSKSRHGEYPQIVHRCGNCNEILYRYYKYCPTCGRSVKWE